MCTCGIAMATQHATPATHSSNCACTGRRPNGRLRSNATGAGAAGIAPPRPPGRCRHRRRSPIQQHHRRPLAHAQRQQQHAHATHQPHQHIGMAPANRLDAVLHDGRPQRTRNVVAAGTNRHRNAAPPVPPQRRVGQQRRNVADAPTSPINPWASPNPQMLPDSPAHKTTTHPHRPHAQHRHQPMPVGHPPRPQPANPQRTPSSACRAATHPRDPPQTRPARRAARLTHIHAAVAQHDQA